MTWTYRLLLALSTLGLVLATACGDPLDAPPGAEITTIESMTVFWDPTWDGDPEYWALARVDFYVSDPLEGTPYNNVTIEIMSGYEGVYILPTGVINVANCPSGEGQWATYCGDPNQTWGELTGDFNDSLRPTFYRGYTDNRGVETIWIWIEDMPVSGDAEGGTVGVVSVTASIGVHSIVIDITGGSG
jgi:hypothetical protein